MRNMELFTEQFSRPTRLGLSIGLHSACCRGHDCHKASRNPDGLRQKAAASKHAITATPPTPAATSAASNISFPRQQQRHVVQDNGKEGGLRHRRVFGMNDSCPERSVIDLDRHWIITPPSPSLFLSSSLISHRRRRGDVLRPRRGFVARRTRLDHTSSYCIAAMSCRRTPIN